MWRNVRYFSSVSIIYGLTLLFALYLIAPTTVLPKNPHPVVLAQTLPQAETQTPPFKIGGFPIHLVMTQASNGLHVDLPVERGEFNPADGSWTLSDTAAFFAMPSMLANDTKGVTLIYGHNRQEVFGYISALHKGEGATAVVTTDNGHTFTYAYDDYVTLGPDDVSIFKYDGPPTLLIQTCGGRFFEYREIFRFNLIQVDGHAV